MSPLAWVTLGTATLTLAFNAVFWFRTVQGYRFWRKRVRAMPEPRAWPRAHVFVCLKGNLPHLRETLRALDRQDYPGPFRITFVTETEARRGDVAAAQLARLLPLTSRCDHTVAGRVLDSCARCAQKNFNLLAGIDHAEKEHGPIDVYAFCDGDLLVRPVWLREMVRPLVTGCSEASTSLHFAAATEKKLVGALHGMAETCQSLAALVCRGATWGGSMAIGASLFRQHSLHEVWSRTVVDDMTLSRALKASKLRVTPVAQFLVRSRSEIGSYRGLVAWLGRQFFFVRIYLPSLYRLLWVKMALNVATLWLATFHAAYRVVHGQWAAGAPAGVAVLLTAAAAIGALHLYRYLIPDRPPARTWFGATLVVHGTSLLACAWAMLRRKRLIWQDLAYFVERDGRVTRVAPADPGAPVADDLEEAVA